MKKLSFVAVALSGIFCFTLPSLSLSAENSVVAPVSQNEMSKETYEKFRKIMLEGTPDDLRKLINGGFDINSTYNGKIHYCMLLMLFLMLLELLHHKFLPITHWKKLRLC